MLFIWNPLEQFIHKKIVYTALQNRKERQQQPWRPSDTEERSPPLNHEILGSKPTLVTFLIFIGSFE